MGDNGVGIGLTGLAFGVMLICAWQGDLGHIGTCEMMDSARSRSSEGDQLVLPPIICNEKDRQFLCDLTDHVDTELKKVDSRIPEQRYIVHKDAFDKIIEYVTAYKPLLTAVKVEYEDCIEAIQRGQHEAFYLTGKLNALATEPSTIHNYRKRADDLEYKMGVIAEDNERLREELDELRAERKEKEQKVREVHKPPPKEVKRDKRHIPGLNLQQSTDVKVLTRELEKLERQLKELNISYKTRYTPIDIRDSLKDHLSDKVTHRDLLQEQTAILKQKRHKLRIAVEAAHAYMKIQPPHQTIGEAVVNALTRSGSQITEKLGGEDIVQRTTPSNSFEEDDPTKEKEAEQLLEYIEKFTELLEDRRYEEAATHAANSPKGILRTPETLHRFMDLRDVVTSRGRSPYMAFCDWLMATVPAFPSKPSDYLSLECVKCALEENRLDLITHWLSQDRLTLTELMGDMILDFCHVRPHLEDQCTALSQKVYTGVQAHISAMVCMVRQHRLGQALEYAQKVRLSCIDCAAVLAIVPSIQLAVGFYNGKVANARLLPMGQVAHTLIVNECEELAVDFIHELHQEGAQDPENNRSPLRKAVFEDDVSSLEQWHDIVEVCQHHGYQDSALDILAAATVILSVRGATKYVEDMEQERLEEKRKQQEEEIKAKEAKERKKRKKRRRYKARDIEAQVSDDGEEMVQEQVFFILKGTEEIDQTVDTGLYE